MGAGTKWESLRDRHATDMDGVRGKGLKGKYGKSTGGLGEVDEYTCDLGAGEMR